MKKLSIKKCVDGAEAFRDAATAIVASLKEAIGTSGRATFVLAGGSTPKGVFDEIVASHRSGLNWRNVDFFFGDERMVDPSHPESNYRMAFQYLLEPLQVVGSQVYRIEGELDPVEAASRYETILRKRFAQKETSFDVVMLGLGDDGHTASLFPQTTAVTESARLVTEVWVPKLNAWRVSLSFSALNRASRVFFVVTGATKASAVARVLEGEEVVTECPARGIKPLGGQVVWFIDQAAAAGLHK